MLHRDLQLCFRDGITLYAFSEEFITIAAVTEVTV